MKSNKDNILAIKNPELIKQWHPTKNGDLTANDVTTGSTKKVWWVCEQGHEWDAVVHSRAKGVGCPCCAGQRTCADNSLQILFPDLAKQWHSTKNGELTPNDVTTGTNRKVWWQCEKGHIWETSIANRTRSGSGCPYCSGHKACDDNSLQTLNPELAKQWHPIKNIDLTPNDVTIGSGKKVWWLCPKGHEYDMTVADKTGGNGCPFCSGRRVCTDNSLQMLNPELSNQWHSTKNGELTPNDVTEKANKKVWWQCEKGHEWQANINDRANGNNCPYCLGRRVCVDNSLQTLEPEISKQWHPTKNGDLIPNNFTTGTAKKVWWQCERGHEWQAAIVNRVKGRGCPDCSRESKTSFPEQAIYFYLKSIFEDTLNRYKYDNKWEIDVFVPSLNFGIEYDGSYYHNDKKDSDYRKEKHLTKEGVRLLRVKETNKKSQNVTIKSNVIYCDNAPSKSQLNEVIRACFEYINKNITPKPYNFNIDIKKDRAKIHNLYIKGEKEKSLLATYPELAKEWHPTKNLNIKPDMVTSRSGKKVWWQCPKGHEWDATIASRADGAGCPYCSGFRASKEKSLQSLKPKLAAQWHPTKNGDLTPNDVGLGSNKKVWWQCDKGHEWQVMVNGRARGEGCPFCSGRRIGKDNSLQAINPNLAKEWHLNKNGDLTANDVTAGSDKKVWWQCEKGHEWQAAVYSRNSGTGCPYCSGQRVCADNSLQALYPELTKEWHPNKNGDLTPNSVTSGSGRKVWWLCECGHEYQSPIVNRTKRGSGCLACYKMENEKWNNFGRNEER